MTRDEIRKKVICAVCKFHGPPPSDLSDDTVIHNADGLPSEIIFAFPSIKGFITMGPETTLGEIIRQVERSL